MSHRVPRTVLQDIFDKYYAPEQNNDPTRRKGRLWPL